MVKQLKRKSEAIQVGCQKRVLMGDGRGNTRICSSPRPNRLAKPNMLSATTRIIKKSSDVARDRVYSG
jgi:hypothetical protein